MKPQAVLLEHLIEADKAGVRLIIVGGLPLWEASPASRHQMVVDRIRATIKRPRPRKLVRLPKCDCFHLADVYILFPDDSLLRPDIAIFCQKPEETDEALTQIPEAVIEIVSVGYEAKDLEISPRFYLSQGVQDVVVFDPRTQLVLHIRRDKTTRQISPVTLNLECGCQCTV